MFDTTGDSLGSTYGIIVPLGLICLTSLISLGIWYYVKMESSSMAEPKDESKVQNDVIELAKTESKNVSPLHDILINEK